MFTPGPEGGITHEHFLFGYATRSVFNIHSSCGQKNNMAGENTYCPQNNDRT